MQAKPFRVKKNTSARTFQRPISAGNVDKRKCKVTPSPPEILDRYSRTTDRMTVANPQLSLRTMTDDKRKQLEQKTTKQRRGLQV